MRQLKISNKITSRESIALEKYLSDIGKIDLLTPEDEASLAAKIREGDPLALERLTKANLRFVVSVAKQYQNQGLSLRNPGLQVHLLRRLVDSPEHHAGHRRVQSPRTNAQQQGRRLY